MWKQRIIKLIDRVFGKILVKLFIRLIGIKTKARDIPSKIKRILVIRPGGLGDAILLTPAIRFLKEKTSSEIDMLCEKRNVGGAKICYGDVIRRFILYDNLLFPIFLLRHIKKYDIVIDTEQSFLLTAVVGYILGKKVFGFDTTEKKDIFDIAFEYCHADQEINQFFKLMKGVVNYVLGSREKKNAPNTIDSNDNVGEREEISQYLKICQQFGSGINNEDDNYVLFAPFTTRWEKMYDGFEEVIRKVSEKFRVKVIGDRKIPLDEVARIVIHAPVFVSVDNGIMHFRIFSKRGKHIAIFGPTNYIKWAPEGSTVIRRELMCSPCSNFAEIPLCPRNKKCMKDITPEEIIREIEKAMEIKGNGD